MQAFLLFYFYIFCKTQPQLLFHNSEFLALEVLPFGRNFVNSYASLLPIIFLSVVLIVLWCWSSICEVSIVTIKLILSALYISLLVFYGISSTFLMNYSIFGTIVAANWYMWFANLIILVFALLIVWLRGMTLTLLLYSSGMVIFALALLGSVDIITFYVSFEALSLLTYGVIATNRMLGSSEGALKYFIYGVISSILLIFGLSLYYITYQSVDWYEIYMYETFSALGLSESPFITISIILIVLAFCYKLSMFPFHFSLPDVYEGSYWETIGIINLVVKLALSLSLFRVWGLLISQIELILNASNFLLIVAILSLIIGCFGGLVQMSLKRLFAYTSINQAGFIILGLLTNNVTGLQASLVYLVTYMLTMFIFFVGVTNEPINVDSLLDLRHCSTVSKFLIATSLFSMAGIPPFFGFIAKYWTWLALINGISYNIGGFYQILLISAFIISILVSLIGAYYYLRLIKIYAFDSGSKSLQFEDFKSVAILLSIILIVFLGAGWCGFAEEIYNLSRVWAIDNYGSWVHYLYTGAYVEWLRS